MKLANNEEYGSSHFQDFFSQLGLFEKSGKKHLQLHLLFPIDNECTSSMIIIFGPYRSDENSGFLYP